MDDDTFVPGAESVDFIALTVGIVSAYVSNNPVPVAELPGLLSGVHTTIAGLGRVSGSAELSSEKPTSAQIRKSIKPDALISFIDGKSYKTLKRHLSVNGLSVDQYRERYGLPRDYPVTAASYSAQRSALAKSRGLGQRRVKAAPKVVEVATASTETPKLRGRQKTADLAGRSAHRRKSKRVLTAVVK